jgi:hypothetical protein
VVFAGMLQFWRVVGGGFFGFDVYCLLGWLFVVWFVSGLVLCLR